MDTERSLSAGLVAAHARAPIPTLLDELSRIRGHTVVASFTISNDAKSFRDVTFDQFTNAVNKIAQIFEQRLGKSESFAPIAYLGPPDLRYYLVLVAANKVGYVSYFPSPRNSHNVQCTLLEQAGCEVFALPDGPVSPATAKILQGRNTMQKIVLPSLSDLLDDSDRAPEHPYAKNFEQARYEPWVILHSSGSTGMPKLITLRHGHYTNVDTFQGRSPKGEGSAWDREYSQSRVFIAMPPFHIAGLFMALIPALYLGMTFVLGPSVPLSLEVIDAVHENGILDGTLVAASLLTEIADKPPSLHKLSRLRFVSYGGSILPKPTGDLLCCKTRVYNIYGATEIGIFPTHNTSLTEWQYLAFDQNLVGCEYRPYIGNLHELVIVRDKRLDPDQPVFNNFPDLDEWSTNDLFQPHPSRSDLWQYHGRKDDIIVLRNGEKFNPSTIESTIKSYPEISAVVVIGQDRTQASLLVEPVETTIIKGPEDCIRLIDAIWPLVQQANHASVGPARISKDLIIVLQDGMRFPRTAKGSIQKKTVLQDFQDQLDALYNNIGQLQAEVTTTTTAAKFSDYESARHSLRCILTENLGFDVIDDVDLFWLGLDSIGVLQLVRSVNSALATPRLKARDIYEASTINNLARLLALPKPTQDESKPSQMQEMEYTYQRLSASLFETLYADSARSSRMLAGHRPAKETVLLTGSTGSLGTYLLNTLIGDGRIEKIYCLNRSSDAQARQEASFSKLGMPLLDQSKVTFLQWHPSEEQFGLSVLDYEMLANVVTSVIHNAWAVDFNLQLSAFEPHLKGVCCLIQFHARSLHRCAIYFLSTVSVALGSGLFQHPATIPEDILNMWSYAERIGYAQSKLIAEGLIDRAASVLDANFHICRIGQIAGPIHFPQGQWAPREWFPSLIRSSAFLHALPETLGPLNDVDWIPVDELAQALVEMFLVRVRPTQMAENKMGNGNGDTIAATSVEGQRRYRAGVEHAVNAQSVPWASLIETVLAHLPTEVEVVPLSEWIRRLSNSSFDEPEQNPATKLMDFFQSLDAPERRVVSFETKRAREASEKLRNLGNVRPAWMALWMTQWF
ncbi:MAG: putative NRPS-like protein biosynthetic cluster [Bathelium mastoideum]|nr:MAG: putative NRPS-like protein biosynthetic cluster [Bathelium mastoideum]